MRWCYQHPWFSTLMLEEGDGMVGDQHSGETSFVAIDIGKAFHAVLVEFPDGVPLAGRLARSVPRVARASGPPASFLFSRTWTVTP